MTESVADELDGQRPMADVEAEKAVLGSMMLSATAADDAIERLTDRDFYLPKHGAIFLHVVALLASDAPTDPIAVARALEEGGQLDRCGGLPYLHTLVANVSIAASAGYFAGIVADWATRRRVLEAAVVAGRAARNVSQPVVKVVETAAQAMHDASAGTGGSTLEPVSGFIGSAVEKIKQRRNGEVPLGLTTGLMDLDMLLSGGWQSGQMGICAARPAMGKSVASMGFAKAAAKAGRPSMFFALEMQKQELSDRLLADEAQVNLHAIRSGELTDEEMDRISDAQKRLAAIPLHVDDKSNSIAKIWAEARRFKQRQGDLGIVAVDYLQRLSTSSEDRRRDLEVGDNASQLKDLAMALDTTSLAVCQLNRGVEMRADKRPMMADLRDSGQLEQEADIIIMLYRDDYYVKTSPRVGEADFIVVKNRNGEPDTVTVAAQLHFQRFMDMYQDPPPRGV